MNEIKTKKTIEKINETNSYFFEMIELTKLQLHSARKKVTETKSKQLKIKNETLQLIPQIYKGW